MSHPACQEQNCPTCYHVCPSSPSSPPLESSLGDGAHGIWHPSVPSRSPCETKGMAKAFPDWGQTGVCGQAALSPSPPTSALPRATSPLASPPPTPMDLEEVVANRMQLLDPDLREEEGSWQEETEASKWDLTGAGHLGQRM